VGYRQQVSLGRTAGAGLGLSYREWNADAPGLPLVLLHGITGSSADWEPVSRHLDYRRAIALDARGHGDSEWDSDEAYGGDQHFADVAMALDALGLEQCILVGFSMGGSVAILAAAALPERVAGVVVVDSYPYPRMTPGSRRIAHWISDLEDGWPGFDPAIARHFRQMLASGADDRLDLTSMWENIQCPALVVRGGYSDVLPEHLAEDMVRRQPRARLATVPGAWHSVPLARPLELAHLICGFADEVWEQGPG
jgi:esterase